MREVVINTRKQNDELRQDNRQLRHELARRDQRIRLMRVALDHVDVCGACFRRDVHGDTYCPDGYLLIKEALRD